MKRKKQIVQFLKDNYGIINSLMCNYERRIFNGDVVKIIMNDVEKQLENEIEKPYPVGSKWLFKVEDFEITIKIMKYSLPNLMQIESIETEGEFRMYSCSREISWFADKLFPMPFAEG